MNEEVRRNIDKKIKQELGISYDEYEKLDFDEQQELIKKRRKNKKSNSKYISVMIGSGENSIFVKKKHGEKYMLADGAFVRAGDTFDESKNRLEDKLDDIIYSKPVAIVKKLTRRIKI